MAGGAIVGALKYLVEVDAERAAVEVDKFLAEAQAKVEAAGGDATYRLLADSAQLDKELAEKQAEIEAFQKQKIEAKIGADTSKADREIARLQAEMDAMEAQRHEIKIQTKGAVQALAEMKAVQAMQDKLASGSREQATAADKEGLAVARLRENYNKLASERAKLERIRPAARRTEGENLALERMAAQMRSMEREGARLGAGLEGIKKDVEGDDNAFRRWSSTLGRTRFSIGPLTTTLGGLAKILPVLSPLLIGLVGGTAALVGSIGAGLVGAFGVATGAAAGFGLALLPLLPALKNLTKEAMKGGLGDTFRELGKSLQDAIRPDFGRGVNQTIKTLEADFGGFKTSAVGAFHAVSQGFQSWMRGLRTPEAQGIIHNLIGNFTKDIGPVMSGIGSLTTAFARFISLASNAGPGFSKTFQGWAQGIEDATAKGSGFGNKVAALVSQARSLGNALTATGRLFTAFFGAGAKSGQDLLDSLTRSENRWTNWMHSVEGQQSLQQFFKDAVANTKGFFAALAPLLSTFVHLGNALAPVTDGALVAAKAIGDVIHTLAGFAPARVSLKAFGALLAGIFVVSKFQAAQNAIRGVLVSIGLMAAEESGATAAVAANTAAIEANTAAMVERAAVGGAAMEATAAESGVMAGAMVEGEAATGLFAGGLASLALPVAALAGGIIYLAIATDRSHGRMNTFNGTLKRFQNDSAAATASAGQLAQAQQAGAKAAKNGADAQARANKLQREGKQNTKAYVDAGNQLIKSLNQQHAAAVQQQQAAQQHKADIQNQTHDLQSLENQYKSLNKQIEAGGRKIKGGAGQRTGVSDEDLRNLQKMSQGLTIARLNLERLRAGGSALPQSAIGAINQLKSVAGNKIAMKFELSGTPQALSALGRLSTQTEKLVGRKRVMKILGDSKNAQQAVVRLNAIKLKDKRLRAELQDAVSGKLGHIKSRISALKDKLVHVKAQDAASPKADQIRAKIQNLKDKQVHLKAIDGASGPISAVQSQLNALHDKTVHVNVVTSHQGKYQGGIMGFAAGGSYDAMMAAANRAAGRKTGLDPAAGALVRSPRYIVGEEPGRTEYIITDNPAYRQSNLRYLFAAASALGQSLIPGYRGGGAHASSKKKKKGNKPDNSPGPDSLDDKTGPGSPYDLQEKKVSLDAQLVDLAKRRYDTGLQGGTLQGYLDALTTESGDYGTLASTINSLITGGLTQHINPTPPGPEPQKKDHESKQAFKKRHDVWARANARYEAQQAHNNAISGQYDLKAEYDTIMQSILPGLQLDILEAQNAANTNTIVGQENANSLRQQVFSQFASNIIGGFTGPSLGPNGLGSFTSNPALVNIGAPTAPGPVLASRAATPGGGVSLTNNFAAPPADPHTWTQSVAFELQAAGA